MPTVAKPTSTILRIVTGLVALAFLATGAGKLASIPPSPANFARWGFSPAFMYAVGTFEVLGAIALMVPRTSGFAALVLIATMFGAIRTGIAFGEPMHVVLPAILVVLLAFIAYARREAMLRLVRRERT